MDLYQQIILDHSKRPVGAGLREPFDAEVHHVNPTCGDEVTLRVTLDGPEGETTLDDISYDAHGCSISVASMSVLAEELTGATIDHARTAYHAMKDMLTSRGQLQGDEDVIGDGVAFAGVSQYPARVKCALLGWTALADALARQGIDIAAAASPADHH
ncbi:MAG TPA: SUF system NifU family Fe-S cluster assembly protein [Dermatophilaceae bacterium]|nr:SUF system NifU family Fe-S cluster assembly protein [Dermatophilaceae bacterium]